MGFKKGETPKGAIPFEKGKSGNPKGMVPGTVSLKALINKILDGKTTIEEAGEKVAISKREAAWILIAKDALDKTLDSTSRHRAVSMLADRTDGKPIQGVELSGPDGSTIQIDPTASLEDRKAALAALEKIKNKTE